MVLINPGSNDFSAVTPTVLPSVANEAVVLDFLVTGTGAGRAVWVLRTSGGDGTFYQSRTVQRVAWPSLVSTVPLQQRPAQWIPWIIATTSAGGSAIIASDDAAAGVAIPLN